MLDLPHILYILISGVITALGLWASAKFAKSQKHKDIILKIAAISTVIIHYSDLWVDFFSNGGVAQIENGKVMGAARTRFIIKDEKCGKVFSLAA